jgi:hypothetical protein
MIAKLTAANGRSPNVTGPSGHIETGAPVTPLYKVLVNGCSVHGGTLEWSLPEDGKPGDWHEVQGPLVQCENGLHLTLDPSHVWHPHRFGASPEAYLVEAEGIEIGDPAHDPEVVARRVRLLRRLTWSELAKFGITPDGIDHNHKHQRTLAKKRYPAPAPSRHGSPLCKPVTPNCRRIGAVPPVGYVGSAPTTQPPPESPIFVRQWPGNWRFSTAPASRLKTLWSGVAGRLRARFRPAPGLPRRPSLPPSSLFDVGGLIFDRPKNLRLFSWGEWTIAG